jgi:hypothetical protein
MYGKQRSQQKLSEEKESPEVCFSFPLPLPLNQYNTPWMMNCSFWDF